MPDWKQDYNASVLRARNAIMGQNGRTAQAFLEIYRTVADSILDFQQQLQRGNVSDLRSGILRRNLRAMIEGLKQRLPEIVERKLNESAFRAVQGHIEGLEKALSQVSIPSEVQAQIRGGVLFTAPSSVVANALEIYPLRQGFSGGYNYKTLINLGMEQLQENVDRLIASGLQRGLSANNLTKELAMMISKNDPDFNRVLRQLGPRGGKLRNAMKTVDLTQPQIKRAKKFLYQMRRIAVSEINNAYTEADRLSSVESEVVEYNRWEVSGRHYGLPSTPDSCTFNAEHDQYGLGVGVFYPETTPPLMHPFCGCYTTKVFRDPEQWLEPAPEPEPPKTWKERGFRRFFAGKTTRQRNAMIDLVNEKNQISYAFYQQFAQ